LNAIMTRDFVTPAVVTGVSVMVRDRRGHCTRTIPFVDPWRPFASTTVKDTLAVPGPGSDHFAGVDHVGA
jgi:hypothetical protein